MLPDAERVSWEMPKRVDCSFSRRPALLAPRMLIAETTIRPSLHCGVCSRTGRRIIQYEGYVPSASSERPDEFNTAMRDNGYIHNWLSAIVLKLSLDCLMQFVRITSTS